MYMDPWGEELPGSRRYLGVSENKGYIGVPYFGVLKIRILLFRVLY